jgi:hypothetical protein
MNLKVFQADKGDCLLLTGADGRKMLIDGGMPDSYHEHAAPTLGQLRGAGEQLDVAYVSHIDGDHIGGVLQMLDDEVEWRVHEYQLSAGNSGHAPPSVPRPPAIGKLWHNGFREQLEENAGPIADMLSQTAKILSGAPDEIIRAVSAAQQNMILGERQAIKVSRRIGDGQLNIPLNPEFDGKLMYVRDDGPSATNLGGMSLSLIGPLESEVERLRARWNKWLDKNKKALEDIARDAKADEDRLKAGDVDWDTGLSEEVLSVPEMAAPLLSALTQAQQLGRRGDVTVPNLASIMFLVEEGGKTLLLTGDGHSDDILSGLAHHGKLQPGRTRFDVLKIPDHYIFSANGAHDNPDLAIVELVIESRLVPSDDRPFKLWFNSSSTATPEADDKKHMKQVEDLVAGYSQQAGDRMGYVFLQHDEYLELAI